MLNVSDLKKKNDKQPLIALPVVAQYVMIYYVYTNIYCDTNALRFMRAIIISRSVEKSFYNDK